MPTFPDIKLFNGEAHAATAKEADAIRRELERRTGERYFVTTGPRNWRDGKPLCYTVALLFQKGKTDDE